MFKHDQIKLSESPVLITRAFYSSTSGVEPDCSSVDSDGGEECSRGGDS